MTKLPTPLVANVPHTDTIFNCRWPCVDIRAYISSRLFSKTLHSRHNMQSWTLSHRRKVRRTCCLLLSSYGFWYIIVVAGADSRDWCTVLYSNTVVDCLTIEPSLNSSFENWMSKVCSKFLCDLDQWAKWVVLYKPFVCKRHANLRFERRYVISNFYLCGNNPLFSDALENGTRYFMSSLICFTLQWRQNEHDGVSNHHHRLWSSLNDHYLAILAIYQFPYTFF